VSHATITAAYEALLASGRLVPDAAQAEAVAQLAEIQEQWAAADVPQGGKLSRIFNRRKPVAAHTQGLYLWGDVGRGKSMLMDLFYETTPARSKRRVHYHAFMIDVHARIHGWREENREHLKDGDPIPPLAAALAKEAEFLCLDEMQVTDVADAMILGRLFTELLNRNVRVVFTSNRVPDDLYLNGLQRDRFLKFIALIHEKLTVIRLQSAEDYRLKQLKAMDEVYLTGDGAKAQLDEAFAQLTKGKIAQSSIASVQGHDLLIPSASGDVARFHFADLCSKAVGAADYEYIAQHFNTVLLDGIPLLNPEKRNEAKRFVTLIDTLYEHKTKLICSAADAPEALYPAGDGSFEFHRTASRLREMQSETYLAASHKVA